MIKEKLEQIREEALQALKNISVLNQLEEFRIRVLGKKGKLTMVLREMGSLPPAERPVIGQLANEIRNSLEKELAQKANALRKADLEKRLEEEAIDITVPGRKPVRGNLHPNTRTLNELKDIFLGMGFDVAEGPEVEWDEYNFKALKLYSSHSTSGPSATSNPIPRKMSFNSFNVLVLGWRFPLTGFLPGTVISMASSSSRFSRSAFRRAFAF